MEPGESKRGETSPTVLFRDAPGLIPADKRALKCFARNVADTVANGRSFTCLVTNDRALQQLNRDFLGHDEPTDVLSFPSGETAALGDLAISVQRAAAQAAEWDHSLGDELHILLLHGVLHLLGYDHESDRGEMARAERKWRKHFALPQTLISRTRRVSA